MNRLGPILAATDFSAPARHAADRHAARRVVDVEMRKCVQPVLRLYGKSAVSLPQLP